MIKEQEEVMVRHKMTPTLIKRIPPGLSSQNSSSSSPSQTLIFPNLVRDFGWTGRKKLEQSGLSPSFVDRLVGDNDKFIMVRYLAPETGQNNMVANKKEFRSMVD